MFIYIYIICKLLYHINIWYPIKIGLLAFKVPYKITFTVCVPAIRILSNKAADKVF